ncbi:hypothetical protein LTR10_017941 [Elasticomyces elasticus]|uniref:DUF8004 domain-containing protein n=1 Tax=Exophiala sideris TaxID=1016849 RepID=A0ABR0IWY6_9EURO|nr:hypothetical protein LTR10_017941 [Elasticomyces elasticus]KAK5021767.1 hypothetical protein LTS07_010662 [Exophiala sideris]KAK5025873.1 hypothetical protein LTR13_010337 [Exophiala sideris]KAK5050237.1 hypothetical protein LTR69_010725 [Exophiala sideris]KAK5177004.1 hypothetical protein LTR44_010441 [Eurotiomycetes sp. CCFEE 6388]
MPTALRRVQGRVTRDDIRSAGLRRWDGRARVTTDWVSLFHEPELCWPTGDCLVYLREPGQSSRGPAFRVHTAFLRVKGFDSLIDRCMMRNSFHTARQCVMPNCPGCDPYQSLLELYIPAPSGLGLKEIFDYHITTRNFFAWLYNRPLSGRTLGKALAEVKKRIDVYRPDNSTQNMLEVVSFAENQRYLDFRECADHALAALYLAEELQIEDLWIDAFSHCVGMNQLDLRASIEYAVVSPKSRALVNKSRLEMDIRVQRLQNSVVNFFKDEVSASFLELPQPARDHLEAFRLFLQETYIKVFGSWPPPDFQDEYVKSDICTILFTDFQNLYQYLVDPESTTNMEETDISKTGGVCTIQNIQAFDAKYDYEPLAQPLPLMPKFSDADSEKRAKSQRRKSWNPVQKRKADKEVRKLGDRHALVAATNSDLLVMDCHLVKKYAEFEQQTVDDDLEGLSVVEGRKVRWMLVYAILQTFHSISPPPKQARNTTQLTYSLCCRPPKQMPWQEKPIPTIRMVDERRLSLLVPDQSYSHTNTTPPSGEISRGRSLKTRRSTFPATLPGSPTDSLAAKSSPLSRSSSLKRLIPRRHQTVTEPVPPKRPSFCEIYVEGYGNGLNEVEQDFVVSPVELTAEPERADNPFKRQSWGTQEPMPDVHELDADADRQIPVLPRSQSSPALPLSEDTHALPLPRGPQVPPRAGSIQALQLSSTQSLPQAMSRESSNASRSSHWSQESASDDLSPTTPATDAICTLREILQATGLSRYPDKTCIPDPKTFASPSSSNNITIVDHEVDLDDPMSMPSVHFNTLTWDRILAEPSIAVRA